MKPAPFTYHDPSSIDEACALLATRDNARALAGGQSLMPMMNFRYAMPDHLIDLNTVAELGVLSVDADAIRAGAMTRQRTLEFSKEIGARCPLIHAALAHVGHRQTRNRGTVGGSLCHLDPSAEIPTVALALDAVVTVAGPKGNREIQMADFPAAYMTPAIEPDELVIGVRFPSWPAGHGYGFVEFARRHGDFAIASASALLEEDANGKITRASLTLGGVAVVPQRMRNVEKALVGQIASEDAFRAACEECRKVEAIEDVHAPSSYRQHLAAVLSRRALVAAHGRVGAKAGGRA